MNSRQGTMPTGDTGPRWSPLRPYTLSMSVLGILLLLWCLSHISSFPHGVALFICLVGVAELTTSEVFAPQMAFSISSGVCMAMILLFGPLPAALGGIAGGLAATLVQRITDLCRHRHRATCLVERALFNMAALGLAFLVSGAVYTASGGTTGDVALSSPLPVALAAASAEVVNSALVVAVASLQTGSPFFPIWRENVSWASPMNVLGMVVGGGGLAVGYRIAGALGAGVFFLSVAMTTYAYRLNVWQTKAQMARLEDMVAQRIEELRENWMKAEAT